MNATLRATVAALAMGLLAASGAAAAEKKAEKAPKLVFNLCDGYGAPSVSGDGMTEIAFTWGIFTPEVGGGGNTLQDIKKVGPGAAQLCDQALSHPALLPKYWIRRTSLLRAKAVHLLSGNQPDAALAALDEADALGQANGDAFHQRSMMLGSQLVRAAALKAKGQAAEAEAVALRALAERPYARNVAHATRIVMGEDASPSAAREAGVANARLSPVMIEDLFTHALVEQRYADVVALFPQLKARRAPMDGAMRYDFQVATWNSDNDGRAEYFKASRTGPYAYALTALGRADEGRAAIAAARARLDEIAKPPPPKLNKRGKPRKPEWTDEYRAKVMSMVRTKGNESLDAWSRTIDLRLLAETDPAAAVAALAEAPLESMRATADIYELAQARATPGSATVYPTFAELRAKEAAEDAARREELLEMLIVSLPAAELAEQIPPYQEAKHPRFSMRNSYNDLAVEGYREEADPETGVTTVRVRTDEGAAAIIEEMAVLRAAELALAAGKSGFVVVDRRDTRHSVASTYYGMVMNSTPDGSSTELDVIFVDAANLPEDYRDAGWRVLDAQAVTAALAPIYRTPLQTASR